MVSEIRRSTAGEIADGPPRRPLPQRREVIGQLRFPLPPEGMRDRLGALRHFPTGIERIDDSQERHGLAVLFENTGHLKRYDSSEADSGQQIRTHRLPPAQVEDTLTGQRRDAM